MFEDSKTLLEELAKTTSIKEFVDAFVSSLNEFDGLASSDSDRNVIEADPLLKIAYAEVDRCLNQGWEYVQSIATKALPSWRRTHEEVPELLRRLQQHIPPSEIEIDDNVELGCKPANIASILFAGWVFESHWHESGRSPSAEGEVDYTTVMRLILKGCEDAELRRSYDVAHIGFENT